MRLIDADYVTEKLNEINGTAELDKAFEVVENAPTVDVFNKIRAEIEQTADEEQKHDKKWAIGLRYAVKIIDKYKQGVW